mmetsp:Transcript_54797/g.108805  ORF Transcript_54797/g.108805 Transcript_54797/m.108805 type:complete len:221 (-) Transcript_54797:483-1145(-)
MPLGLLYHEEVRVCQGDAHGGILKLGVHAACPNAAQVLAAQCEDADTQVALVSHSKDVTVRSDAVRLDQLPIAPSPLAKLVAKAQVSGVEGDDAVVLAIRYKESHICSSCVQHGSVDEGEAVRLVKEAILAARAADLGDELAVGRVALDDAASHAVSNVDEVAIARETVGLSEETRAVDLLVSIERATDIASVGVHHAYDIAFLVVHAYSVDRALADERR